MTKAAKRIANKQMREIAVNVANAKAAELKQSIVQDTVEQTCAAFLFILNRDFGFGKTRMQRAVDHVEDLFYLIQNGKFWSDVNIDTIVKEVQELGVDVTKSQYNFDTKDDGSVVAEKRKDV